MWLRQTQTRSEGIQSGKKSRRCFVLRGLCWHRPVSKRTLTSMRVINSHIHGRGLSEFAVRQRQTHTSAGS